MDRARCVTCLIACVVSATAPEVRGQCLGVMAEDHPPPAVRGMGTGDPGFRVRYWAWDDLNRRRSHGAQPTLVDQDGGVLIAELDWADAGYCQVPGPVARTAVLLEALGPEGFGRWALVNLGGDRSGDVDVDAAQHVLGRVWSQAADVPAPRIEDLEVGPETIEVELGWDLDYEAEALSDLVGEDGQPLPSVRGFAVYVVNGPEFTPRPWDWSFEADTEVDAANGFSTDTSASLVMPRGIWNDVTVCFALALTFDGNGDAEGELPDSRSVHGELLGRPSPWVALPDLGTDLPVTVTELRAWRPAPLRLDLGFLGQSEPAGARYRVWIAGRSGRRQLLTEIDGGLGTYRLGLDLPGWCARHQWRVVVEMLDAQGRVVSSRATVALGRLSAWASAGS